MAETFQSDLTAVEKPSHLARTSTSRQAPRRTDHARAAPTGPIDLRDEERSSDTMNQPPFDGSAPGGRPEVRRPDLPGTERHALVRHVEQAPIVLAARGYDSDVLAPERARNVPMTYHTDGTWIWPSAVGSYLRAHGVPPEPELPAHIRLGGFQIPDVADDVRSAAVSTITGSE
jgi:hypothetical protein